MVHSVFSSGFSRLLSVATVLTLVISAASADLPPETALASTGERADFFVGASNLEDNNGNNDDDNRNHENWKREDGNGKDREVDTGPLIASAGNGGVATASADGGAEFIGDVNSGGNAGNAIGVGDTSWGPVAVDGGDVANSTGITVTADGDTGIADASGGNNNLAAVQG